MSFSKDFAWGAATAAYQIEGAAAEDGKGPSIWDMCSHKPGFMKNGDTGDVACDHYHRYKEDVALIKAVGLKAYRLSVSWARIMPEGTGRINQKGLDFYIRLIEELLAAGITPWVTLYHWDLPMELFKQGGWLNPHIADWFAGYTKVVVERLSDRVTHWMTLNEPQMHLGMGHALGLHAPGLRLSKPELLLAAHHMLLAHGRSASTIRSCSRQPCRIGWAAASPIYYPATQRAEDIAAAREALLFAPEEVLLMNAWWLDPVYLGSYPEEGLKHYEQWLPTFAADDLETICQPLDFFGVNIYEGIPRRAGDTSVYPNIERSPGFDQTAIKWAVTPEALYWGPKFYQERYGLPVVITENGMSNADWVQLDGRVHDPQRIDFMHRYLRELKRAVVDGVKVDGYFAWSILDNLEWSSGYNERLGLIHVDFTTQKRTVKDSARWYKRVIESNGEVLGQ
ncbi:MAG: beta-glucosidase [Thermoleophilia bacterium]|nr:beta-glucosidase [Thermoleophilia bacterium]